MMRDHGTPADALQLGHPRADQPAGAGLAWSDISDLEHNTPVLRTTAAVLGLGCLEAFSRFTTAR